MSEFDDKPITSPEEDSFGFNPLAEAIADGINADQMREGTVIAVNGPWGSGKSSVINLVRHHLDNGTEHAGLELEIVDFKCWWFRGEEALTIAFFSELYSAMNPTIGRKAKKVISKLGTQFLLGASSVVGLALNVAVTPGLGKAMSFIDGLIKKDETVEKLYKELSDALRADSEKRYLIVIDDIDRLSPDEAMLIFRLVKSVGGLPNVMYLLAYDRQLAEKIVTERYPSEGPHYLEKIVQASFDLPQPNRSSLNREFSRHLNSIIEKEEFGDKVYSDNLFYEIIAPEIKTPRDILRILNPLKITWGAVKGEVDPMDFLCLETWRIQRPELYRTLSSNKGRLTGTERNSTTREPNHLRQEYDDIFLQRGPDSERERLRNAMMRLFPALKNIWINRSHDAGIRKEWERQRRVCSPMHFDTYFRFALPNDVLSSQEIEELISRSGDPTFVQHSLLDAGKKDLPNGGTKAIRLLRTLCRDGDDVPEDKIGSLLKSIYSIADSLVVDKEKVGETMELLRLLTRKLTMRLALETRSAVLLEACSGASLGCLVVIASLAYGDHSPSENTSSKSAEECLTTHDHALELKDLAIERIRKAADDGSLINCPLLDMVLRWWGEVGGNDREVRSWASFVMKDDVAVARLAKAFTGSSSSFSLGDSVARRNPIAETDKVESIVDLSEFRARAEQVLEKENLKAEDRESLATFLGAWREQDARRRQEEGNSED